MPESLQKGDDVVAFMARAVPQAIRQRALRALWRTDPILACVDGLNDYDGDFTGGGVPMGTLKTAYDAGRGYAKAVLAEDDAAPAAERAEPMETAAVEAPEETAAAEAPEAEAYMDDEPEDALSEAYAEAGSAAHETPEPPPQPTRRRMRFAFADPELATAAPGPADRRRGPPHSDL